MSEEREINWAAIELEYRAGIATSRQLGERYGVSHTAINKRAKKEGWTRDLTERIRAKADEKVSSRAVSKDVAAATEAEFVDAVAEEQATIRLHHRAKLKRGGAVVDALLEELEVATLNREALEAAVASIGTDDPFAAEALARAISLPSRAKSCGTLIKAMVDVIGAERIAHGIDEDGRKGGSIEDLLLNAVRNAGPRRDD